MGAPIGLSEGSKQNSNLLNYVPDNAVSMLLCIQSSKPTPNLETTVYASTRVFGCLSPLSSVVAIQTMLESSAKVTWKFLGRHVSTMIRGRGADQRWYLQHASFPTSYRPPREEVDEPRPVHALAHLPANLAYTVEQAPAYFVGKKLGEVCERCDGERRLREMSGEGRRRVEREPQSASDIGPISNGTGYGAFTRHEATG